MSLGRDTLHSLDCDYITCSAPDERGLNTLHSLASQIMRNEAERGNKVMPWSMKGYRGWRCGHIEIGVFEDRVLVRCSADVAANSWARLVRLAEKISRIDLQATVVVQQSATDKIERHRKEALRFSKLHDEIPIVRWIQDNRAGYTLYLGARESNVFGRIYDKFAREQLDQWKGCVRYEVQFNKRLAGSIARSCVQLTDYKPRMNAYVSQFFRDRGVRSPRVFDDGSTFCCHRSRTDADRKLEWLQEAVRPSVLSLIALGRGDEVLRALGLVED